MIESALNAGLDKFTLTGVARDLGVSTPSLYRIIDARADLVDLCLRHISQQKFLPSPVSVTKHKGEPEWQSYIWGMSEMLWDLMQQYPGLSLALAQHPGAPAHGEHYIVQLKDKLVETGFPGKEESLDFIIHLIGDTVITTDIFTTHMRSVDSYDLAKKNPHPDADEVNQVGKAQLETKVQFIIDAVAAGVNLPTA
ncbi:hypothetical protein GP475_03560 [Corynebacterium poyangense]|uniref:Uncharacterized protein n=1 Tax=Corynebacterium poyangense TaxID=2684405 RepID=A0A7H0SMQ5_9CORY|nr:hypothetical protein [Corynebacterium poyangense]MBZ8176938.1 hypothetical protein [Corynebacterium poyangense]QNQ89830.1 hypothetical protein GP475_03560 [Corynebacterium poyangense]